MFGVEGTSIRGRVLGVEFNGVVGFLVIDIKMVEKKAIFLALKINDLFWSLRNLVLSIAIPQDIKAWWRL